MKKEPKLVEEPSGGVRLDTDTTSYRNRADKLRPGKLSTKSKNQKKIKKNSSRQNVFTIGPAQSKMDRSELEKYIEDGKRPVYGFPHLCFDE